VVRSTIAWSSPKGRLTKPCAGSSRGQTMVAGTSASRSAMSGCGRTTTLQLRSRSSLDARSAASHPWTNPSSRRATSFDEHT
jgi:hypothetical protein